jgi:hypothetical protein
MIILDENVPDSQRVVLRGWRIRARQIGEDLGRAGMADDEIIPLLQSLTRPTFFTRDRDFLQPWLCHPSYCIVFLEVGQYDVATFVRRTLRHTRLNTWSKRMGTVVRVSHRRVVIWRRGQNVERLDW